MTYHRIGKACHRSLHSSETTHLALHICQLMVTNISVGPIPQQRSICSTILHIHTSTLESGQLSFISNFRLNDSFSLLFLLSASVLGKLDPGTHVTDLSSNTSLKENILIFKIHKYGHV